MFIKTEKVKIEALRAKYWPGENGTGAHPRDRRTGRDLAVDAKAATKLLPKGEFDE